MRPHHEHLAVAGRVRWRSLPYAVCCWHPLLPPVQTAASGVDTCHQPAEESRALRRVKPQRHRRGRDCAARELVKRPFHRSESFDEWDNSQLIVNRGRNAFRREQGEGVGGFFVPGGALDPPPLLEYDVSKLTLSKQFVDNQRSGGGGGGGAGRKNWVRVLCFPLPLCARVFHLP